MTKNSHIAGQKSGCRSGQYAPICCQSVTEFTSTQCYATTADHLFSGSLASRTDTTGISDYIYDDTTTDGDDDDDDDSVNVETRRKKDKRKVDAMANTKRTSALAKRASSGSCPSNVLPLNAIAVDVPAALEVTRIAGGYYYYSLSPTATISSSATRKKTIKIVSSSTRTTTFSTRTPSCDGNQYPQACFNYYSVGLKGKYYSVLTCRDLSTSNDERPLTKIYNAQHNTKWVSYIAKSYYNVKSKGNIAVRPQRDEWPPAHFQQGVPIGYIRMIPGSENSGAANDGTNGWKGFCKYPPEQQVKTEGGPVEYVGDVVITTIITSTIITLNVFDMQFTNLSPPAGDIYALTTNVCWPSVLTNDPGFALFTYDAYYGGNNPVYSTLPITKGISQPKYKRDLEFLEDENGDILVEDGDEMRKATDEELAEELMIKRCATPDCAAELEEQRLLLEEWEIDQPIPPMIVTETVAGRHRATGNALNALPAMTLTASASQATATRRA